MKQKFKTKLTLSAALSAALTFVGCNIFNPTEDVRVSSNDAEALTYEGYMHFQKSEYSEAREYFEKAIKADSAYSEAWYGRAKAVLNMQPSLNLFQLISYAKKEEGQNAVSKFMSMPEEEAKGIKSGVDSVLFYLDPFIQLDTTGRTDKRVQFGNFSNSYAILQMTKLALTVRTASIDLQNLFSTDPNTGTMSVNWSDLSPSALGEATKETFNAMAAMAETLKSNPEATTTILRDYVPGSEMLSDTALVLATEVLADQIINVAKVVDDSDIDRGDVFLLFGNHMDDDGDGCIDEEVFDGADNDGDGEVDEDVRANNTMVPEIDFIHHSPGQIQKVLSTEDYQLVDIDGDGIMGEEDSKEYEFEIPGSNDRKAQDNHLFKFANTLSWSAAFVYGNPELSTDIQRQRIELKELIRKDKDINNIQYPLAMRKAMIGGCWNNYDEARFLQWFEGRK
ncbi:MAG: hypothetical protein MJY87_08555 [Fibrobacter sp.]|nr:hypothetical protein [Fibrobacter sp.]